MEVTPSGIVMLVRSQFSNARFSISFTLPGIVMLSIAQFPKELYPMLIKLFGKIILFKLKQFQNATFPIIVTPSGIVTLVRRAFSLNTPYPISFTPSGMTTSPPGPLYCTSTPSSITNSSPSAITGTASPSSSAAARRIAQTLLTFVHAPSLILPPFGGLWSGRRSARPAMPAERAKTVLSKDGHSTPF